GNAGVEIVQKSRDIGIGGAQHAIEPERVGGADRARAIVRLRPGQCRFLVRKNQIGADIAARGKRLQKTVQLIRRDRLAPIRPRPVHPRRILPRHPAGLEPVIVKERRRRMFDRPANDASGRAHASSTTELRSTPISGLSISMVSPGLSQTGGSDLPVFFTGVPVQTTSPALSVMKLVV